MNKYQQKLLENLEREYERKARRGYRWYDHALDHVHCAMIIALMLWAVATVWLIIRGAL